MKYIGEVAQLGDVKCAVSGGSRTTSSPHGMTKGVTEAHSSLPGLLSARSNHSTGPCSFSGIIWEYKRFGKLCSNSQVIPPYMQLTNYIKWPAGTLHISLAWC